MNLADDDFTLLGMPQRQALDAALLDERRRRLQAEVHPDRFAAHGAAAQRIATQWAVRINEAWRHLKDPLKRAARLCALRGVPVDGERAPALPPAFLQQQMAWREALEEASTAEQVRELSAQIDADERQRLHALELTLDEGAGSTADAAAQVRALMFVARLREEVESRLDRLDPAR